MEMPKVSSKGQINSPIAIRKHLGLNEGDKVIFIPDGNSVRMFHASNLKEDKDGAPAAFIPNSSGGYS